MAPARQNARNAETRTGLPFENRSALPENSTRHLPRNPHLTPSIPGRNVRSLLSKPLHAKASRPHRRRRAGHRRTDQTHPRAQRRGRSGNRRQRRRRAESRRGATTRSHHPGPEPAGPQRARGLPGAAFAFGCAAPADHHADGEVERERSRRRPRTRRGRLRHQAVQPARTDGARPRGAAAEHDGRRTSRDRLSGHATHRGLRCGRRGGRRSIRSG